MGQFILKRDNLKFGLLLGFFTPFLGVVIYYYWKISPNTWSDFFHYLKTNKSLVTSMTMVCLFLNVVVFTIYINTRRDKTAKGVFAITVVFAIASLLFKYFG
ncbi:MAG: hypothetical protein ABIX01_14305 [Chitinophagaceae bacterium]